MSATKKEEKQTAVINPLVFISHDTRDAEFAEAFGNLLKSVSAGVLKSFRSSDKKGTQGIEYGVEWYPEIINNLQNASDVVCLLTENSVDRPWILFEAGMAKGKLDTPILGIALGVPLSKASTGPFAQFQNCSDDEESLTKLVFQLVDRIPNSEPDEETIKFQVGKFKSKISELLKKETQGKASGGKTKQLKKEDSSVKLFEEIKVMFQDLPSRIEGNVRVDYNDRRKRRLSHMVIDDLIHMNKPNIGIMAALSLMRESLPWIYDLGMETIKIIQSAKTKKEKRTAFLQFEEAITISTDHPKIRKLFTDTKDDYILMREMPRMILKGMDRLIIEE